MNDVINIAGTSPETSHLVSLGTNREGIDAYAIETLARERDELQRAVNIREIRMRQAETRQEAAEQERDELRAEVERLKAQTTRLRNNFLEYVDRHQCGHLVCVRSPVNITPSA
jgi:chromosome segregation ATPase